MTLFVALCAIVTIKDYFFDSLSVHVILTLSPLLCSGEKTGFKIAMQHFSSKDNILTVIHVSLFYPNKLVLSQVAMLVDIYFYLATKILCVYILYIIINVIMYSCSLLGVHYMSSCNEM